MSKIKILFVLLLTIFITVPLFIFFNSFLYEVKFYILTILGVGIYLLFKLYKVKNDELGIGKSNILTSLKRNIPIIILMILICISLKLCGLARYNPNENLLFYIFYIFISCPIQEFLYRGIFRYFEINLIKNRITVILLSSFCYSFVHIIYKDLLTCIITFIMGCIWLYALSKR